MSRPAFCFLFLVFLVSCDSADDADTDTDAQAADTDADIDCSEACATATCPAYRACSEYYADGTFRSWLESGDGMTWDCSPDTTCLTAIDDSAAYCGVCN